MQAIYAVFPAPAAPSARCEPTAGGGKIANRVATRFASLLLPLDRSPVAELAIPFAVAIARRSKAALEFSAVHRAYFSRDSHAANAWALKVDQAKEAEVAGEEHAYLDAVAARVTADSQVPATATLLTGSVASAESIADRILEHAQSRQSELIVMTTRALGRMSRLELGSVADELVRRAHLPILLVSPGSEERPHDLQPRLDHFLIPLDGSELSAQILDTSIALAALMGARCTLLRVLAPKSSDGDLQAAEQYLQSVAAAPSAQGLTVQMRVVRSPKPVDAILQEAESLQCNLITLATHGYGGFKRLLLGSVADKLIRRAAVPMLVYCPARD